MNIKSVDFVKFPLKFLVTEGLSMKGHLIGVNMLFPLIVCNTLINMSGQSNCVITSIQNGKNLALVANFIFTLLYILSAVPKIISILNKRLQFKDLLDELNDIVPRSQADQRDYRAVECLKSATRMSTIFAIIQITAINYISFSSNIISFFAPRPANETWHAMLPYGDAYPFYKHQPYVFPILFFIQVWEGYICIGIIYAVNFVTYGILIQICMHYEHLAWKLKTFDGLNSDKSVDNRHIIWCISKHNQLNGYLIGLYH